MDDWLLEYHQRDQVCLLAYFGVNSKVKINELYCDCFVTISVCTLCWFTFFLPWLEMFLHARRRDQDRGRCLFCSAVGQKSAILLGEPVRRFEGKQKLLRNWTTNQFCKGRKSRDVVAKVNTWTKQFDLCTPTVNLLLVGWTSSRKSHLWQTSKGKFRSCQCQIFFPPNPPTSRFFPQEGGAHGAPTDRQFHSKI